MAYFEWAEDMVIDSGPIDDDHQKLVALVNQLHTATTDGRGQEVVGKILEELVAYTAGHLQREERLMESLKFPHLAPHRVGHEKFMHKVLDLKAKFDGGSITVASQLSTVLRDWLSLPIRRSDKEIKLFLDKRATGARNKPPRSGAK
jgi:hemerythrin-like metal-binding protein